MKYKLMTYGGLLLLLMGSTLLHSSCTTLSPTLSYGESPKIHLDRKPPVIQDSIEVTRSPATDALLDYLHLEDCIALALVNNPDILAMDADHKAAQADIRISRSQRLPNIQLTGNYAHHIEEQRLGMPTSSGQAIYYTKDIVSSDVILRLPLYAGGRIVNEFKAMQLMAEAAEHNLARTKKELVFNITSLYYSILSQQHVIASTRFAQETLSEHLTRTKLLVEAQKVAPVDALRTEVRLANISQQLLQEENTLAITYRVLANQLGIEVPTLSALQLVDVLEEIQFVAVLDEELDMAYRQRDDLSAALASLDAQARRVDMARGQREPNLMFEIMYGGRWSIGGSGEAISQASRALSWTPGNPGSLSLATTTPLSGGASLNSTFSPSGNANFRLSQPDIQSADSFREVGSVGLSVNIPIFEGGRIRAQITKEQYRLQAEQQRLRKLELLVRLEVETALLNLDSAHQRLLVTRKSIREAEESLRIEFLKYEQGKGTIVDILDAQSALLETQTSYYRALADLHTSIAQLRLARGDSLK